MAPFAFPPPPPPPPKPSYSDNSPAYASQSQRGGHNRGRGDGGRGRERGQNRGGGNSYHNGNARGGQGHGQSNARGNTGHMGNHRGAFNPGYRQQQYPSSPQSMGASPNSPSAGAYVHPALSQPPLVDPNALAQVMSFMATPAGQQSMTAFANHMANVGNHTQPTPRFSPPQHAGQKRKLNDRNTNAQTQKLQQQSSKPPRAKAAVAPPIPSFGFSLPTIPAVRPQTMPKAKGKKDQKKGKLQLGLTNQSLPDESSEGEGIDEEAAHGTKLKGGGFAFEHQGEQITLQTAADVAAWIKDRKKKFPTQRRILDKADESAAKRTSELEFLRRLKGGPSKVESRVHQTKPPRVHDKSKGKAKMREELAALRKKLHESMVRKNAIPTVLDLGVGYGSDTGSDEESSVLSESSVVSSSEESPEESGSESEDEAPEPISSKMAPRPVKIPPPIPSPAARPTKRDDRVCLNWERHGICSYSHKCKFKHPPSKEDKRPGLYEVLVEQELVKQDQLGLDVIKYLGQHGFLG